METLILKINVNNIDLNAINTAAGIMQNGGLVAFPTETVYGLGANALDTDAVNKIFIAKGRPSDNPLIVHIARKEDVNVLAKDIDSNTVKLMDAFWPGPITFVLEKTAVVPDIVTAGLDTVAVRMPAHPIALALISASGLPVAAPSANISGSPSTTQPQHVIEDLFGKVDIIIDGGVSDVGLESTVLDMTTNPPMILRPGGVSIEDISGVIGNVDVDTALNLNNDSAPRSPGMKYIHYSPNAKVIVVEGSIKNVVSKINSLVGEYNKNGVHAGVLATRQTAHSYAGCEIIVSGDRKTPEIIASNLFSSLREFDRLGVEIILAEAIDTSGIGFAVMNRMVKAAGFNIIKV